MPYLKELIFRLVGLCLAAGLLGLCATAQTEEPASDVGAQISGHGQAAYALGNYEGALFFFEQACHADGASSCFKAGEMYETGLGTPQILDAALYYYDVGCGLGDAASCKASRPYYQQAIIDCAETDAQACVLLGSARANGLPVTGSDPEQAFLDFDRACDLGYGPGCSGLGQLYAQGLGIEQSNADSIAHYELGCRRGDRAICGLVGDAYAAGAEVDYDAAMAMEYYRLGCEQADVHSCKSLGYAYWDGKLIATDTSVARAFLQPVCDAGDVAVCNDLPLLDE
ncbi:MAG: tetratricopeptide repeat protein [Pseudomonadota bacterium]